MRIYLAATLLLSTVLQSRAADLDPGPGQFDPAPATEIMELFKKLNEQERVTIVQVTHSEHNATYGNRIIRLKDGLVVR